LTDAVVVALDSLHTLAAREYPLWSLEGCVAKTCILPLYGLSVLFGG